MFFPSIIIRYLLNFIDNVVLIFFYIISEICSILSCFSWLAFALAYFLVFLNRYKLLKIWQVWRQIMLIVSRCSITKLLYYLIHHVRKIKTNNNKKMTLLIWKKKIKISSLVVLDFHPIQNIFHFKKTFVNCNLSKKYHNIYIFIFITTLNKHF